MSGVLRFMSHASHSMCGCASCFRAYREDLIEARCADAANWRCGMSGVDVLAVLDREIEAIKNTKQIVDYSLSPERQMAYTEHLESLVESRAAVAEMIESLDLIESAKARGFGIDYAHGCASAALARCRGGAS